MSQLTKELAKFGFFFTGVFVFIYFSEKHIEFAANQFLLNDIDPIYHAKNYSKKSCPLYPDELGQFLFLYLYKFQAHFIH